MEHALGHPSEEPEGQAHRLDLRIRAEPENLGRIRRALVGMKLPDQVIREGTLLTSELVTNSIRHAGLGPDDYIEVAATWSGTVLRVIVRDSGSAGPAPEIVAGSIRPSPGGQSGWGLYLVDKLATRWGTNLEGSAGFWFEIEYPRPAGPSI
jgi:anti-sigma regulatory factor (Ser/Thr protein kinase)